MLSKVQSATLVGVDAVPVGVEVDVASRGLPHFSVVGLPDAAVKESRDRVRAALKNIGFNFPLKPITANLAPADLKKEGSAFDLPIAVGLAAGEGAVPQESLTRVMLVGELSLDGRLNPVRGALSLALLARGLGLTLLLPSENADEAAIVEGADIMGVEGLPEVISYLRGESEALPRKGGLRGGAGRDSYEEDFSDVKGQEQAQCSDDRPAGFREDHAGAPSTHNIA
jgi:magnesium chelatase family protein